MELSKPMTIDKAAEHYKGTGLTRYAIRKAVLEGKIPCVRTGWKYLITLAAIEQWVQGEPLMNEQ